MARPEHLRLLRHGVTAWNAHFALQPEPPPNLSYASLRRRKLDGINLASADLRGADLRRARLCGANLSKVDASRVDFGGAQLAAANLADANIREGDLANAHLLKAIMTRATLDEARLSGADLTGVDLRSASLLDADLTDASLQSANLQHARLQGAILRRTNLAGTNLGGVVVGRTTFDDVDLKGAMNIRTLWHQSPSSVSLPTLLRGAGAIPTEFLVGCGLSDFDLQFARILDPSLSYASIIDITYEMAQIRGMNPIQVKPLFISYSHVDSAFVNRISDELTSHGIRFWRDVHDLAAGRLDKQLDRAIRLNPTVLIVLSRASVESDWVQYEASAARRIEKELGRDVLCPVTIDDAWRTSNWPGPLRQQIESYNILDFSEWLHQSQFKRQFRKLVDGLRLFY